MSRRARLGALGSAVCLAAAIVLIVPFLMAQGGETPAPAKPLVIDGVSLVEAATNGFVLTQPEGESPATTADQAIKASGKAHAKATLAHLKNVNAEPDIDRLVWAIVVDPPESPPGAESDYVKLEMDFVDAKTGEWFIGYGEEPSCTDTPETMAECQKRGIKPRPLETPVFLPGY